MINLLLGAPGGGKSYEAVAYHIIPALERGRLVVTNLSLNIDSFAAIDPAWRELIELRTISNGPDGSKLFGVVDDYGHTWRHPKTGSGPLYVIDECHIPLPRIGTPRDVEEWYSLHRHETADVLLITQSYGKINQAIRDLVQIVYRVRKATAFGSETSYIRKVQDGLRGDIVNTSIRKYESKYFPLYKSHTKGGGSELAATDIVPFWKRWPVIGAGLFLFILLPLLIIALDLSNPFNPSSHTAPSQPANHTADRIRKELQNRPVSPSVSPSPESQIIPAVHYPVVPPGSTPIAPPGQSSNELPPASVDPYSDKSLHVAGYMRSIRSDGTVFETAVFNVSQNGQRVASVRLEELKAIGYTWSAYGDCSGVLTLGKTVRPVSCELPQIHMAPPIS